MKTLNEHLEGFHNAFAIQKITILLIIYIQFRVTQYLPSTGKQKILYYAGIYCWKLQCQFQ